MGFPKRAAGALIVVMLLRAAASAQSATTAGASAANDGTGMRPGLWEVSTVVVVVGSQRTRTDVALTCYTPEDVRSAARVTPSQLEPHMKCDTRDVKQAGDTITWRVSCIGTGGTLGGIGKITIQGDRYSGQASLVTKSRAKTANVEQKITGKIMGDCG